MNIFSNIVRSLMELDARQDSDAISLLLVKSTAIAFGIKFMCAFGILLAVELYTCWEAIGIRGALPKRFSKLRFLLRVSCALISSALVALIFNAVSAFTVALLIAFAFRDSDDNDDRFDRFKRVLSEILPGVIDVLSKLNDKVAPDRKIQQS